MLSDVVCGWRGCWRRYFQRMRRLAGAVAREVFFAAHERGEDAKCRDAGADEEGDVEGAGEGLLERGLAAAPGLGERLARRGAAEAGEDGAGQRYTDALADDAPGGEEAGGDALPLARGGAH